MSGYKRATVTISEQEYRRLHEADMKRRFQGRSRAKERDPEQTPDLANTLLQMENRQRHLEHALGALGQHFSRIESETMQDILMQNALCYESLAAVVEETASRASESIYLMSQHFAERMDRERDQYRQSLHTLLRQVDIHEQKDRAKEQSARQWLRRSVILSEFIQDQLDHERFIPGRLPKILRSLEIAQGNLAEGFFEASLQLSQQMYLELSDLHFELEQRVVQWQAEYERTCSAVRQIVAELETSSKVNALGLQGEELPVQVDLNYWTNGKYVQLLEKCRQLLAFLAEDRQSISMDDLGRVHTQILPTIYTSFGNLIYEARLNALNSQLRMNIADRALQALENHGFNLSGAGYADDDMRAPFRAYLENPDGSRVTIQVIPTDGSSQELTNELVVITNHPYLKTEHEARLHWEEMRRTLHQYHLEVSQPDIQPALPPAGSERMDPFPQLKRQPIHLVSRKDVR